MNQKKTKSSIVWIDLIFVLLVSFCAFLLYVGLCSKIITGNWFYFIPVSHLFYTTTFGILNTVIINIYRLKNKPAKLNFATGSILLLIFLFYVTPSEMITFINNDHPIIYTIIFASPALFIGGMIYYARGVKCLLKQN